MTLRGVADNDRVVEAVIDDVEFPVRSENVDRGIRSGLQIHSVEESAGVVDIDRIAAGTGLDSEISHAPRGSRGCAPLNSTRRETGHPAPVGAGIIVKIDGAWCRVGAVVERESCITHTINVDIPLDVGHRAAGPNTADSDLILAAGVVDKERPRGSKNVDAVIAWAGVEFCPTGTKETVSVVVEVAGVMNKVSVVAAAAINEDVGHPPRGVRLRRPGDRRRGDSGD